MTFTIGGTYILLWLLALVHTLLIIALLKQLSDLQHRAAEGHLSTDRRLPVGAEAPQFSLNDARSGRVSPAHAFAGRSGIVLFLSTDCAVCVQIAHDIASLPTDILTRVLLVCRGAEDACNEFAAAAGPRARVVQIRDMSFAQQFGVHAFPTAVVVDSHWRVAGYRFPRESSDLPKYLEEHSVEGRAAQGPVHEPHFT